MERRRALTASLVSLVLAFLFRKFMPEAVAWVLAYLAFAAALGFLAAYVRGNTSKMICITVMSLLIGLGAFEAYLRLTDDTASANWTYVPIEQIRKERNMPELQTIRSNLIFDDPVLGMRHKAEAMKIGNKVLMGDDLIFDAVYTILETGWRITPSNPDAKYAVVFFGCSFTYGEGLDDEESMPYKLGDILGKDYQVFNYAYTGYGAHQMLAQIQNGYVDDIVKKYEKTLFFFLTIEGHAMRAAGYATWDRHGPWYELENGKVVHKGRFPDKRKNLKPIHKFFRKSMLYRKVTSPRKASQQVQDDLHIAIVTEADKELREKSGTGLTVLAWPEATYGPALEKNGIEVLDLTPAFPGGKFSSDLQIPHDGHPNAKAMDMVTRFLVPYVNKAIEQEN